MVASNILIAALASTSLISLAPNVILFLFPHYGSGEGTHSQVLSLGQAMAAGGLLGDVFLHTLPHAKNMEEDQVGMWVLGGFLAFFLVDLVMRSLGLETHGNHDHSHNNTSNSHDHKKHDQAKPESFQFSSTVLLNLAADALHNFTDGVSIGASFSLQSSVITHDASLFRIISSRGGLATLSIMCHEIPHELGDFCTLVKAGCSKKQAILLQFATAVAALIGTVVGVYAVQGYGGERLLYATAGGFVYLATVTILPEVLEEGSSFRFRILQFLFFCTGLAFLYAVAFLEHASHDGAGHGHGHHHEHHPHFHHHDHTHHHDHHSDHQHEEL